jgi:hypothetical protein
MVVIGLVALLVSPLTPATGRSVASSPLADGPVLRLPVVVVAPAAPAVLEGVIEVSHRAQGHRSLVLLLVALLAALGADAFRRPLRRFGHRTSRIVHVTLWTFRGRAPPAS